jgi:multicomponent K+:H+ antiporter subunit A
VLPWLGALLVAGLPRQARRAAAAGAGRRRGTGGAGLVLSLAPAVFAGQVLRWSVAWLPALGMDLGLRLDGLAWLFALLITGIGALVVLYAAWYLDPDDPAPRFFAFCCSSWAPCWAWCCPTTCCCWWCSGS